MNLNATRKNIFHYWHFGTVMISLVSTALYRSSDSWLIHLALSTHCNQETIRKKKQLIDRIN